MSNASRKMAGSGFVALPISISSRKLDWLLVISLQEKRANALPGFRTADEVKYLVCFVLMGADLEGSHSEWVVLIS